MSEKEKLVSEGYTEYTKDVPYKTEKEMLPDLESQEFFDLMQQYRIAPMFNQELVIECYNRVKSWLKQNKAALPEKDIAKELYEACIKSINLLPLWGCLEISQTASKKDEGELQALHQMELTLKSAINHYEQSTQK